MSETITLSEAPTTGLGRLLLDNRFYVPSHQRDYRWDIDRVGQFFDDLIGAMDRTDKYYFIGLMVFMQSPDGRLRVLDGQQRLATTIIFLSAIRAWFGSVEGGSATGNKIQYDFIGKSEYGQSEVAPTLHLNLNNDGQFQQYVVNGSPLAEVKKERTKISRHAPNADLLNSIIYCHERVAQIAEQANTTDEAKDFLHRLVIYMRESVIAVRLTVPNESNAFRVFETLNDRGLDLSSIDLIKNYLFGLAYDVSNQLLSQVETRWLQITQTLTDQKELDYLKVYWTARYGRTQLDQIFDDSRVHIKTGKDANAFTIDFLEGAEHYVALDSADDPVWSSYPDGTRDDIRSFRQFGSKQAVPVLLAGMKRFTKKEFRRLLRLMEVISVRWQLIGGRRTGTLEIQSSRLAVGIWNEEIKSAKEARELLSNVYLSDDDFREAFAMKDNLSNQKAAQILRRLEDNERRSVKGAKAKELDPGASLTLEHIFPRNSGVEWEKEIKADPDLASDWTGRLGNMCLLTETLNQDAERKHYDYKKTIYKSSDLLITQHAGSFDGWNRDNIEKFQYWLAKRAVDEWKFN